MADIESSADPVTPAQLKKLQKNFGSNLPPDYIQFLQRQNGGIPTPDCIAIPKWHGKSTIVTCFFGLTGDEDDDLIEMIDQYEDRIPAKYLPIADDAGGNIFCLDSSTGKIYLWDHEEELDEQGESVMDGSNMYLVASSIDVLLKKLRDA